MGIRASLMAIKTVEAARVLDQLGLVETGEYAFGAFPDLGYAVSPSGWTLIIGPEEFATPERLTRLSASSEAVGLVSSETVMVNEAHGYSSGVKTWSVTHDPERGSCDLETEGTPPAQFSSIRDELVRQQQEDEDGDVDFVFDAAVELVASVCGFRWDQVTPGGDPAFKLLEPAQTGPVGERQARRRSLHDALAQRVEGELYALARSLGFERAEERPDFLEHHYPVTSFNLLVREREGSWDSMMFVWNAESEPPKVEIYFYVRPLLTRRDGRNGLGHLPTPKRSLLDQLLGRNKPAPETLDSVIEKMSQVIVELDAYFKDGTPSPRIIPPVYAD